MPSSHARLSPSAAERWLSCPASVLLIEELDLPDEGSTYAQEGTLAHALGELEVSREFELIDDKQYLSGVKQWKKDCDKIHLTVEQRRDMEHYIEGYVELVRERLERYPNSTVMVEQRMDSGVPTCWGTSDIVIVSPVHVEIIDLKYGQGVAVSAVGNPQLRLYGLGALDTFGDMLGDTEEVYVTVYQPRINSLSTDKMSPSELREWRELITPIAQEALEGTDRFGPGEEPCRWCPLSGKCKPQAEWIFSQDTADPHLMSPADIQKALDAAPAMRKWLEDLEKQALTTAYEEHKPIPGYKVVMSGGTRKIVDEGTLLDRFEELGFESDLTTVTKVKGLGDLESLLKELPKVKPEGASRARFQRLEDVLPDGVVVKGEGRPALVPESDKREPIDNNSEAAKVFSKEEK